MKIKPKTIAFWGSLIAGVGLSIGGIFVPPLMAGGLACFSVALALAKDTDPDNQQTAPANRDQANADNQSSSSGENVGVDVHVDVNRHHRHHLSFAQPSEPVDENKSVDNKADSEQTKSKFHRRLH